MSKTKEIKPYTASIKILAKVYTSVGDSVKDAIGNLKPTGKCAGTSVLSITHGELKKDRVLSSVQTYRLFSRSPLMREVQTKNVSLMFSL
jgi:hypothetical protein